MKLHILSIAALAASALVFGPALSAAASTDSGAYIRGGEDLNAGPSTPVTIQVLLDQFVRSSTPKKIILDSATGEIVTVSDFMASDGTWYSSPPPGDEFRLPASTWSSAAPSDDDGTKARPSTPVTTPALLDQFIRGSFPKSITLDSATGKIITVSDFVAAGGTSYTTRPHPLGDDFRLPN